MPATCSKAAFKGLAKNYLPVWGLLFVCTQAFGVEPHVVVETRQGILNIEAQINAPRPLDEVRRMMTDYEQIPNYMPNVDSSRVVGRTDSSLWVHQVFKTRLILPWTFRFTHEFVEESPTVLRFKMLEGNLSSFTGVWRFTPNKDGTQIAYTAAVGHGIRLPGFLMRYIAKRQVNKMMPALVEELERRHKASQ
jgi:uncharacterized membrane protein